MQITGFKFLFIASFLAAACLPAQPPVTMRTTESNSPERRQACQARVQAFRSAERIRDLSPAAREQVRDLRQCPESAPLVLPQAWRAVQADSLELMVLMDAAAPVRDRRIAAVLEEILEDQSRPSLVRQAAAVVLTTYVVRRFRGIVKSGPIRGDQFWVDPVAASFVISDDTAEPPDAGLKNRVIAAIERVHASSPPDRGMMYPLTRFLLTTLRQSG